MGKFANTIYQPLNKWTGSGAISFINYDKVFSK